VTNTIGNAISFFSLAMNIAILIATSICHDFDVQFAFKLKETFYFVLLCIHCKRMGQIAFKNPHSLQTLPANSMGIFFAAPLQFLFL